MLRTMWVNAKSWLAIIPFSLAATVAPPAAAQNASVFDPNAGQVQSLGTPLGPDEQAILLEEVERYFNGVSTLKARFLQFNMDGSVYQGSILLSRPGKMAIDYDDPIPYRIISDGNFYIFIDEELEETSHIPLGLTPAAILLRQPLNLGDDLTVRDAARDGGALFITLTQTEAPDAGSLTMAFQEEPLALKQWTVIDAQGLVTRVMLIDPETGVEIDDDAFVFVSPWGTRESGN